MKGTKKYGKYYWCVKSTLSRDGEIYVDADKVVVTEQGDLICSSINSGGDLIVNLGIAKGYWTSVFAASCMDGSAIAVQHWVGEVDK